MRRGALLFCLIPAVAWAAGFTLRSEVDARKIGVEDQLQLTLTVEGSGGPDEIPLPALTNLEVVGGPYQSTQVSVVNGRMSQSHSFVYALRPRGVGKAEVGAAQAGDQTAPALSIDVVAGRLRQREPQRDPFGLDPFGDPFEELLGGPRRSRVARKLILQSAPSRTRLHVGEPLVLTYSLLTQTSVTDLQLKEGQQFSGFWVEDLETPRDSPSGEAATVDGESYRRFIVVRKLLFPTKAGTLVIPAATFRIHIARRGFFDNAEVAERATQPATVTVDPLPDAAGFSGAVGRFRATASLDRDTLPLGEAATLRFRVEGIGNLKWIDRGPDVAMKGARVFPPQTKSDLKTTAEGIAGSRTWEFVVVPETSGRVEVPSLPFTYFDPKAGQIVTAETGPLALQVEGAGAAALGPPSAQPAAGAARAGGALALRSELDPHAASSVSRRTLALLAGLALLLHGGLLGAGRLLGSARGEARRLASPRAVRAVRHDLARVAREPMSKEQAAALVEKALHDSFGEVADGDDGECARAVRALLDDVRFVRYAPQLGDYSDKVKDLAARASEAVRRWA